LNHIYRLVWSRIVQGWVAVAETASGRGRRGAARARTRLALRALMLPVAAAGLPALAQTVVLAPGQQAGAYLAPNGATVVDIANPNAAGVSHNRFLRYDVGARGLVLNNTTAAGAMTIRSLLAGSVSANYNAARPASIIVNEVMSSNRSVLAGYTEVVGRRADVVVANPFGITCNGCGFINTDRVTLSTGLPRWGADGSLQGMGVTGGDILVTGTGLNATAQQILDLVTRSVRLEAPVNAQDLGVAAGTGTWSYADRSASGAPAPGSAPAYAIDSSTLGGMYANAIRLVATEAGVGVRMLGEAAANGADFTLSAGGAIALRNRVSAGRDVLVASAAQGPEAIALSGGSLTAAGRLQLAAQHGGVQADQSALVAGAGLDVTGDGGITLQQANLGAGGAIALEAAQGAVVAMQGTIAAGGALAVQARQITAAEGAQWRAGGALQAGATAGDLALGDAGVQAAGSVTLGASGTLSLGAGTQQGVQSTGGNVTLQAGGAVLNAGAVSADAGALAARAGSRLENAGTLNAGGNIDLGGDAGTPPSVVNTGSVLAGQVLTVNASDVSNTGALQGGSATLAAASLANAGRLLATRGSATLAVMRDLENSGTVQAATDLVVQPGVGATLALGNDGRMVAGQALDLHADTVRNAAGALLQGGTSGSVQANALHNAGTVLLARQTGGRGELAVTGALANGGVLQSNGQLALQADTLHNAGTVLARGDAQLALATLDNQGGGSIVADGTLGLVAGSLGNAVGATLQSSGAATVSADSVANTGTLLLSREAGGTASLDVTGNLANTGSVQAAGNLRLAAASFDNAATGTVAVASDLRLQASTLHNAGSLAAGGQADVAAGLLSNDAAATIRGAAGLTVAFDAPKFQNAGLLQAGTGQAGDTAALSLYSATGALRNTGDIEAGSLDLTAAGLSNSGSMTAAAGGAVLTALTGDVRNEAGGTLTLGAGGSGTSLVSGTAIANAGTLQSQDGMQLAVGSGGLQNTGSLLAGANLAIGSRDGTSYTASLDGKVGAGGLLAVSGDAASTLQLVNAADVQGGSVDVHTGRLDVGPRAALAARGSMAVDVGDLALGSEATSDATTVTVHTGRILGGLDGTAGTRVDVTVGHDFSNDGLVYSATDLKVSAPHLAVGEYGALSALNDLQLAATAGQLDLTADAPDAAAGTLVNQGLLYAGHDLSARVNGMLTNAGAVNAGHRVDLVANTLVNNRDIDSQGDLRIVATHLRNEVAGGDRRVFTSTIGAGSWVRVGTEWDDGDKGGNVDEARNWQLAYTETLAFPAGEEPTYWPRLTAQNDAALYFHVGSNLGGLVQATNSVLLQGFTAQTGGTALIAGLQDDAGRQLEAPTSAGSMASFTNDSLAQVVTSRRRLHTETRKLVAAGPKVKEDWHWCSLSSDAVCNGNADHQGYPVEVDVVDGVTAINPVGYAGARIYTASLSGGGFTLFNEGATTPATFQPAEVQGVGTIPLLGAPVQQPLQALPSGLPGAGTRTGWTPLDMAIHPLVVAGADGQPLQAGLSFGGMQLRLPTGGNGLFVASQDPASGYLVESNPLYQVGSPVAGSDYLRNRLGLDTDGTLLRLGDGSYEAWVVQQQLLAQTGSMLLNGQTTLAGQMQALWDNAAQAGAALGLVWGQALTEQQQAALQKDIVWMVRTEVNGRGVLVPVVYLSQATKDGIRKGAIISAQGGTLQVEGAADSGTVEGVTLDNRSTLTGRGSLGGGPGSVLGIPPQFRDQSFEIVKAYLLSASGGETVAYGDVNAWLAKNRDDPVALGSVLPYAYQRFMSLATGGGVMSASDKAFVTFVGEYAKQQRVAAIDDALSAYAEWKAGPKLGQEGKHALLTSLFDLGESPPDEIKKLAQSGISWNSNEEAQRIGAMLGSSVGAVTGGAAAGGASAALMNQIFPFLGRALASSGSSITALSTASGPFAIVTAAAAIAGQAIAKVVKDASFEKDLRKLRAEAMEVPASDVGYWLKKEGGGAQFLMSMAKMMAG
jgi:filamentous hemagglutinin family protein